MEPCDTGTGVVPSLGFLRLGRQMITTKSTRSAILTALLTQTRDGPLTDFDFLSAVISCIKHWRISIVIPRHRAPSSSSSWFKFDPPEQLKMLPASCASLPKVAPSHPPERLPANRRMGIIQMGWMIMAIRDWYNFNELLVFKTASNEITLLRWSDC